jgi:hypothetical protein
MTPSDGALPGWFSVSLRAVLSSILGLSLVGLPAAILGVFRAEVVLPVAVALAAVIAFSWQRRASAPISSHIPSLAALLVVGGFTALNVKYSSEHLLVERDPGVYVATAAWLASSGGLIFPSLEGPFADAEGLRVNGAGFYGIGGIIYPQFLHMLPVLMGSAAWLGGTAMALRANAVLGGVALLAMFAFATRLLRPWWALAAVAGTAALLPQVYFSRDAYSEIPTQLFLFAGLWALWDADRDSDPVRGLIAGVFFGATCLARIDSFLYLIPLTAYLWVRIIGGGRVRFALAVATGVIPVAGLGLIDGFLRSPGYLGDLWPQVLLILIALGLVTLLGAVAWLASDVVKRAFIGLRRRRRVIHLILATALVAAALFAYWIRPRLGPPPAVEGGPTTALARLSVFSFRWLSWYVGPVALAAGIGGVVLLLGDMLRSGAFAGRIMPFLGSVGLTSGLYLWNPSIAPDHIWAMRRFVPIVLPGLMICAMVLSSHLWMTRTVVLKALALALVVASLAFPLQVLLPLRAVRAQAGVVEAVDRLCAGIGPEAAVLVARQQFLHLVLPQTIQALCNVPVASEGLSDHPIEELAAAWAREGRDLFLVSAAPPGRGSSRLIVEMPVLDLEQTHRERPNEMQRRVPPGPRGGGLFRVYVTRVPTQAEPANGPLNSDELAVGQEGLWDALLTKLGPPAPCPDTETD